MRNDYSPVVKAYSWLVFTINIFVTFMSINILGRWTALRIWSIWSGLCTVHDDYSRLVNAYSSLMFTINIFVTLMSIRWSWSHWQCCDFIHFTNQIRKYAKVFIFLLRDIFCTQYIIIYLDIIFCFWQWLLQPSREDSLIIKCFWLIPRMPLSVSFFLVSSIVRIFFFAFKTMMQT